MQELSAEYNGLGIFALNTWFTEREFTTLKQWLAYKRLDASKLHQAEGSYLGVHESCYIVPAGYIGTLMPVLRAHEQSSYLIIDEYMQGTVIDCKDYHTIDRGRMTLVTPSVQCRDYTKFAGQFYTLA